MVKLQISQKDVLLIIMDYLREHNMIKSLITLENESQISLIKYSKEQSFLRNLILEGQWNDADVFIKTIFENSILNTNQESVSDQNKDGRAGGSQGQELQYLNSINYQIKKQIYLELLFNTKELEVN